MYINNSDDDSADDARVKVRKEKWEKQRSLIKYENNKITIKSKTKQGSKIDEVIDFHGTDAGGKKLMQKGWVR